MANAGLITIQGIGGTGKTIDGFIRNNNIDRIGYPTSSEVTTTVGHRVIDVVTENGINRLDVEITNNDIDDTSREAIFVSARGTGPYTNFFDVLIDNNRLGEVTPIGQTDREAIEFLSEDNSRVRAIISNNMIHGNTSALDQVVDIDAENTSTLDLTFTGNTVTNVQGAGGREIAIDTENGTSNLCLEFTGNTAAEVEFNVNGTFRYEDFAGRAGANPGVGAFIGGGGVDRCFWRYLPGAEFLIE